MRSRALFSGIVTVLAVGSFALNVGAYSEDFESYSDQQEIGNQDGWSSVANDTVTVLTESYTYSLPKPLPSSTHDNIAEIDNNSTNTAVALSDDIVYVDTMLLATPRALPGNPDVSNDVQVAMYVDTNGYLNVFSAIMDLNDGSLTNSMWSQLSNTPITTGDWVRLSLAMDYTSDAGGLGYGYYQITLDSGTPLQGYHAVVDPADVNPGTAINGTWFIMPVCQSVTPTGVTALETRGTLRLDDLVVTNTAPSFDTFDLTTVVVGGGGTVLGAGTYPADTDAIVIASNTFTHTFSSWSGDTNGTTIAGNVIDPCPMDANRTITANFTPITESSSGIPIQYFVDNGLTNYPSVDDAEADDPDGDGPTTGEEYLPGTDPNNSNSVFVVLSVDVVGGSNCVSFYGTTNNGPDGPFGMLWSTNLLDSNGWTLIESAVNPRADDGTNIWYDPTVGTAQRFYRPYVTNAP